MSADSKIEWCDHTFNPWWGCTKVSTGCALCYAERLAKRQRVGWGPGALRRFFGPKHWDEPLKWNAAAAKAGTRKRVFCASMADMFDNDALQEAELTRARGALWDLIRRTPNLDWLLLTKRIGNAAKMVLPGWLTNWPANVWLGISVVDQDEADRDIPKLQTMPARIRFLSMEPLLGFMRPDLAGISWCIVGGESGPGARPMHPGWARSLRDQCIGDGVPFFFKQWGEWAPATAHLGLDDQIVLEPWDPALERHLPGFKFDEWQRMSEKRFEREAARFNASIEIFGDVTDAEQDADGHWIGPVAAFRLGKKRAGRLLDGREWNEFPATAHAGEAPLGASPEAPLSAVRR